MSTRRAPWTSIVIGDSLNSSRYLEQRCGAIRRRGEDAGQGSVGRQFFEPEIVNLTVVAVAAINGRNWLASGFRRNSVTRTALLDNWIWGLSLIALTIAIHATSVTFMVSVLHGFRVRLESRRPGLRRLYAIVIGTITTMGLLLAALHVIEAAFWAAAYLWLGAFGSLEAAILYSVDSIATRGASGLMLQSHWQMMGALEAADGVLLFGISTAFIFTVMQFYYQHLVFRASSGGTTKAE